MLTHSGPAQLQIKKKHHIFLPQGSQYWVFKDTETMPGYPRPLSDWGMMRRSGQPVDWVEAAFIWAHNGKTYLFSGGEFWRFDESQTREWSNIQPEAGYPRDNSLWAGVPSHMDDIISWGEGNVQRHKCVMIFLTLVQELTVAVIFRRCLLLQGQLLLGAEKRRTQPRGCDS